MSGWRRACGARSWTVSFHPGGAAPSITTFSHELGHARQTCGKAMQLLEQEGLLIRVPGLGYYVAKPMELSSL